METSTLNIENLDCLAYNAIPLFHYPQKQNWNKYIGLVFLSWFHLKKK